MLLFINDNLKNINISKYTKNFIINIIYNLNNKNYVVFNNNREVSSFGDIKKILKISNDEWNLKIVPDIKKHGLVKKIKINNEFKIIVNPEIVHKNDFVWRKHVFDEFDDCIKLLMTEIEYLKLKSNWYEVNLSMNIDKIDQMKLDISGIYRLYKNGIIVYIGKSVCIKKRLNKHKKEKDIDSFDFTILNNSSDKNLYEIYYIDKYKPLYNKDCIESSIGSITLDDLTFSNIINCKNILQIVSCGI